MAKTLRVVGSVLLVLVAVLVYRAVVPALVVDTAAQTPPRTVIQSSGGWALVPDPQSGVWRMNLTTGVLQHCNRPNGIEVACQPFVPVNPKQHAGRLPLIRSEGRRPNRLGVAKA